MNESDDLLIACLDAFVQVAETRTRTAAAVALGRSQPQVSRDLQALERWLRTPLFDGSIPVHLSPFGEQFLNTAKQVVRLLRDSRADASTPTVAKPSVSGRDVQVP